VHRFFFFFFTTHFGTWLIAKVSSFRAGQYKVFVKPLALTALAESEIVSASATWPYMWEAVAES
jgi:hypothetical protein